MMTKKRAIIYLIVAVMVSIFLTTFVFLSFIYLKGEKVVVGDEKYQRLLAVERVGAVVDAVESNFYKDIDKQALIDAAVSGIVTSLKDPYSAYFTNEEYKKFMDEMNGELTGIGVLLQQTQDNQFKILKVYENTPAALAGILQNDMLIGVDGKSLEGKTLQQVSSMVQGEKGTMVIIEVQRNGVNKTYTLKRAEITFTRISYRMLDDSIGYIRIDVFSGDCVKSFKDAVSSLKSQNMKGLIVDVRGNPGGSLNDVVDIADELIGEGVIVSTQDRGKDTTVYKSKTGGVDIPMALLVNDTSASASEILAAAIQDNKAGTLIGTKTYGKGIVQTIFSLENGLGWLKLTTSEYYTPNGRNIHGVGVQPDIKVTLDEKSQNISYSDRTVQNDAQLAKAIETVEQAILAQGK